MNEFLTQSVWADRMGWVLIHTLWQFAVVALLAGVAGWALRRCSAAVRYGAWLAAMFLLVAAPVATWFSSWSSDAPRAAVKMVSAEPSEARRPQPPQTARPLPQDGGFTVRTVEPSAVPNAMRLSKSSELPSSPFHTASWWSSIERHVQPWLPEIVLAWLIGVIVAASRPVLGWCTVRRLKTSGVSPVRPELLEVLQRMTQRLKLRRAVTLLQSTLAKTPVVVGHFRPVVLLPLSAATGLPIAHLESILAHELAHIRRYDYLANLMQTLVETLFFYHPAVWWLSHQIRNERENCCDDVAMAAVGNRADYGRALLAIEELRSATPALSLAAHGGSLLARIRRIAGCEPSPRVAGTSVLGVLLVLTILLAAATWAAAPETVKNGKANGATSAATKEKDKSSSSTTAVWKPGQTFDFYVVNAKTKKPLPGVSLHLQCSGKGINFRDIKIYTTDARGRSEIRLPDRKPNAVRIYTSKVGFVPLRIFWGSDTQPAPTPVIPKTVTIAMEPGTVWGGVVQNEQGQPIPNVKVNVRYWEKTPEFNPYLRVNIDDDIPGTTTDKNGRWRLDILPAHFDDDGPRLFLTHPDYVSDHLQRGYCPMPIAERPSYKSLQDQTAVMVLGKGTTITGRVTDRSGKPISGAVVCNEYDCYTPDPLKIAATTDQEGHFHLSGLSHRDNYRDYFFTVKAAGFAPAFVEVDDAASKRPVEVKLQPGRSTQGRVVDKNGKPIAGVTIRLDYWRGRPRQFYLKTATDAAGRFRIDDAPLDQTQYDVEKKGFLAIRRPLPPASTDYILTLKRPLSVTGTIVDAATNKPLVKCRVIKGYDYEDGRNPQWETAIGFPAKEITAGRYELKFTQDHGVRIRVEADGYMPAVSRLLKPGCTDDGHVTCDFKLSQAPPMSGTVLGLDGKPLAGAEVFLATQQFNVHDGKAGAPVGEKRRMTKTDRRGRFEFSPESEPFCLIVLHDEGHIVLTEKQLAVTPTIRIKPWSSQDRQFSVERKPSDIGAKTSAADLKNAIRIHVVDPAGKPVEGAHVCSFAEFRAGYNFLGDDAFGWRYWPSMLSDREGMAHIPKPYADQPSVVARHVERKLIAVQNIRPEQRKGILTLTLQPECLVSGKLTSTQLEAHHKKLAWSNVYVCLEDGFGRPMSCGSEKGEYHFCLPPGTYKLYAYGTDTQSINKEITVKPGQRTLEVDPIDLPAAGLTLLEGKPAPELRDIVAWKNGGPVKLSDLRGKVVILAFSTQWGDDRYHGRMPELFPLYEKYHDRGLDILEVRLLGFNSDVPLEKMIAKIKKPFWPNNDFPIPIALAYVPMRQPQRDGKTKAPCAVMEDYGLVGIPGGVLIDRQGRVVGTFNPKSRDDLAALERAIGSQPKTGGNQAMTTASGQRSAVRRKDSPNSNSQPVHITLAGNVVDPKGKPVAGATVYLREWSTYRISSDPYHRTPNDILATTQTDAQGAFRFDKAPAKPLDDQWLKQIPWDVVVVAKPYALAWRHLDAAQTSQPMRIQLTPGVKISGHVIDSQDRPVQNAEVRISDIQPLGTEEYCSAYADPNVLDLRQSRLMNVVKTDADGQVTIEGLPSDRLIQLNIHHDAFRSASTFVATTDQPQPDMEISLYKDDKSKGIKKVQVGCKRFVMTMEPPLPKLIGRVLAADTKKPLPEARITGWGVPGALTDQNGQFVAREVQLSQCHAIINAPEGSDYLGRLVFIDVPQDKKETHVNIELPRGEVVSGIVVDDAGQGVAGVSVVFDSGMGLAISEDTPERTMASYQKTGRDGRFRIAVPSGKGKLLLLGPVRGYQVPRWQENDADDAFSREINVTPERATPEVKFVVQRMATVPEEKLVARRDDYLTKARKAIRITVKGTVVDPEGKPVAGAEVGLAQWFRHREGEFHPVKTDRDGQFSFQVKPYEGSEEFIVATHKERKLRGHLRLSLKPQEETRKAPVVVQLVPTGIVRGRVVEGDKPIGDAQVFLHELMPTPGHSDGASTCTNRDFAVTDAQGWFEFPLVEANKNFWLEVLPTGRHTNAQYRGQVETGKTLEIKPFSLLPLDKSVAGTVVDPDGHPVSGATVSVATRSGQSIPNAWMKRPTGKDGRFIIRGVPDAPLSLMAYIPSSPDAKDRTILFPAHLDVEPGQTDVRIVLDPKLVRRKK